MQQRSAVIHFSAQNFVEPEELDPLLPFLPAEDVPEEEQSVLQTLRNAPDRSFGASLVQKMREFRNQSIAQYQVSAKILDHAHDVLADEYKTRNATLYEIACEILPSAVIETGQKTDIPAPVLYAVHTALLRDDIGFRRIGNHPIWSQFEISSKARVRAMHSVRDQVRSYREMLATSAGNPVSQPDSKLSRFVARARSLIDQSRNFRERTPYGTIGPLQAGSDYRINPKHEKIQTIMRTADSDFLSFIESWVAVRTFPSSSSMHGIGSAILRAIDRYEGCKLDQLCGWILLKEIGAVLP